MENTGHKVNRFDWRFWIYYKELYESCSSNRNFLEIVQKYENEIKNLDKVMFPKNKNKNKDIILSQENLENIFLENKLIATRLGSVETKFVIKQIFNKDVVGDKSILKDGNDDSKMKSNAGLYYSNESDKQRIQNWWCGNAVAILTNPGTTLTSCFLFLPYDLTLLSLLNIKNKHLNNYSSLVKLIYLFENKKVLLVSNGVESMKKSFAAGLQRVYKKQYQILLFTH
jgi:hypothetical protein